MNVESKELFSLIKSLNTQEKRFFKLYINEKGCHSAYIKLFNSIDKLKEFDEKKLTIYLNKNGGIKNKIRIKNYLQSILFEFLEYYHANSSTEIQLQRYLQRVEILYNKRLFITAKKNIAKAEKIAIEHHLYLYILLLSQWKKRILLKKFDQTVSDTYVKSDYQKELEYISFCKNVIDYEKINVQINAFINRSHNLNKNEVGQLKSILKSSNFRINDAKLSIKAKIIKWKILGDVSFLLKKWEECYSYLTKIANHFDKAQLTPNEKISIYSRLTIPLKELKREKDFNSLKNTVDQFVNTLPKKELTADLFNSYLTIINNFISYQINILNTKEGLLAGDPIVLQIEKHASAQNFIVFYFNRLVMFIYQSDFKKSLYCVNKILTFEKNGIRQDIVLIAKILCLLVHYELENEAVVSSYARSFDKQLKKEIVPKILSNFFSKTISKNINKQDNINAFVDLKKKLKVFEKENIFDYFEFISWTESKIQSRPMIEILKEKANSK